MDAGEERCIQATPCYWYHISTTLYSVVCNKPRLLPRSPHEPTSVTEIAYDHSIIASYHRSLAESRP